MRPPPDKGAGKRFGDQDVRKLPVGFRALIAAQFVSSLADNALLIVTMDLLQERGLPMWWAPLLKLGFTISYVLLAPVLGPFADAYPKSALMNWMNGVKALGVVGLLAGLNPVIAFCAVGLGAAAYAPAKYGLMTELVGEHLVVANGWLESSVVAAVLLGTVLGGVLVSPGWQSSIGSLFHGGTGPAGAVMAYDAALMVLLLVYACSSLANRWVPESGVRYLPVVARPMVLWADFIKSNRILWRDPDGGLSLGATSVFWGASATLQFVLIRWAEEALDMRLYKAAYLQAMVAVGVIAGAVAAARWVRLPRAKTMLVFGVGLGCLLPILAATRSLWLALALLTLAGAFGGLMVVPLNALLQQRGYQLLSAGRSIAVQGFNENLSVLVVLTLYTGLLEKGVSTRSVVVGLGIAIAVAAAWLMWAERRRSISLGKPTPV